MDLTGKAADIPGYEGFDDQAGHRDETESILDELGRRGSGRTLFDINSDALPDVVVTQPGTDAKFPFYVNGAGGAADTFGLQELAIRGVLGATASTIRLSNDNLASCDLDGDGTIDWLHQPAVKSYAIYSPALLSGGWTMVGRAVPTAGLQDPHLDLGDDTPDVSVVDANGDGLVDVVRTTGAQLETFFALGRYPGGDGNFGSAAWTGPASASLSLQFVPSCIPLVAPGVPLQFSASSTRVGDMNGDGLADLIYVNRGDVRYWPGRGDGSWGVGPLGSCTSGFAENTYVSMVTSPAYSDPDGSGIRLDDVNGDGLDDLVQIRIDAVDIWLNVDGATFTAQPHTIEGVQPAQGPLWASKVRIADVNGSGTRDILWGEAGHYRYIDLAGGNRPWMLTHVDNGLGKTTDITYASSTELMLAAAAAGQPWQSTAPMPLAVVQSSIERDNLQLVGRPAGTYETDYVYRDPVYDGRQREFRGFRSVVSTHVGDANSPTSHVAQTFLLGECADDEPPPPGLDSVCAPQGRWADNPREALKGLSALEETYDDSGVYSATTHHQYTLRKLYTGLDGRAVRASFESEGDTWEYGTAEFAPAAISQSLPDVLFDSPNATAASATLVSTTTRSGKGLAQIRKRTRVDSFGNGTDAFDDGCTGGDACPAPDSALHVTTVAAVVTGDASGWLWRTRESFADGLAPGEKRDDTTMTYDANGRLTESDAVLSGSLALDRFHETGAPTAGNTAPGASIDGTIVLTQTAYDAFGNVVATAGANGRCRTVDFGADFADLVVKEHVAVGLSATGSCGALAAPRGDNDLSLSASYDRGLDRANDVFDVHGEHTHLDFDAFGRQVRLWKPSPSAVGALSPIASVLVDYDLATPTRPYSVVHTQTQEGAGDGDPGSIAMTTPTKTAGLVARSCTSVRRTRSPTDTHFWSPG